MTRASPYLNSQDFFAHSIKIWGHTVFGQCMCMQRTLNLPYNHIFGGEGVVAIGKTQSQSMHACNGCLEHKFSMLKH